MLTVMLQIFLSYVVTLSLFVVLCILIDTASSSAPKALMAIVGWLILFFPVLIAAGGFYFIWSEL